MSLRRCASIYIHIFMKLTINNSNNKQICSIIINRIKAQLLAQVYKQIYIRIHIHMPKCVYIYTYIYIH